MAQLLVIVSKDKPHLYEYLRRSYALQDGVQVLLDRRDGKPVSQSHEAEGRSPERRRYSGADSEVVFREVGAPARPASSAPRLMFADRDWTRGRNLRLRTEGAPLPWPGLAP
jgi:hypothetical protein